jgi:hypothetical protein
MSAFSSKSGRLAAILNSVQANNTQAAIDARLNGGQGLAIGAIDGSEPLRLGAIDEGYDTLRSDLERARGLYAPYRETGLRAWDAQADAAGLNGAEGNSRASGAFKVSPSYDWDVKQSMDQAARGAAASGQLLSGNAATEMQDRAHHLADQEYATYYDRLKGIADRGYQATGAQASIDAGMGDAAYRYGSDRSAVYGGDAAQRAAIYTGTAAAGANALSRTGDRLTQANSDAAAAEEKASENRINLGLGVANSIAGIAGRYLGGRTATAR